MGDVIRILITGAAGFIGRTTVAEARRRGLDVVAVVRQTVPQDWAADSGIQVVHADLSDPASVNTLSGAAEGCGAVIHAAAHLGGDAEKVQADTLLGTHHLLSALPDGMPLVLVSSIAVYDTMQIAPGSAVTEDSPLGGADIYGASKLEQEEMCRAHGRPVWLIRPGAVWGAGRTWHALNGFWAGPLFVQIASDGELPLVHVDSLARTLFDAALSPARGVQAVTVVDDDRPTRARFIAAHRKATSWPKASVSVPWTVWLGLTKLLSPLNAHLPGLLREPVLRARVMPLRYPNDRLRGLLGGADDAPFEDMLARSVEGSA